MFSFGGADPFCVECFAVFMVRLTLGILYDVVGVLRGQQFME